MYIIHLNNGEKQQNQVKRLKMLLAGLKLGCFEAVEATISGEKAENVASGFEIRLL